jgi:hypothetical protein
MKVLTSFKIGEGGWIDPGTGPVRREPTQDQTDLDVIQNPSRYAPPNDSYYSKALIPADIVWLGTSVLQVRCRLNAGEYDFNVWLVQPQMREIGLFDADGELVAYFTVDVQVKTLGWALENYVTVTF